MAVQHALPPLSALSASTTITFVLITSATGIVYPAITLTLALGPAKNALMTALTAMGAETVSPAVR
jgi:hypothetical protein